MSAATIASSPLVTDAHSCDWLFTTANNMPILATYDSMKAQLLATVYLSDSLKNRANVSIINIGPVRILFIVLISID